ncbi:MAG TPA: hypothetical protein VJV75_07965 [Candidatus Polarisedimenticolia bacterium]|nr:hypothetical protein [Candidatus Polarisedimenticolia bacterium]
MPAMVTGYNTDVEHAGRVYHVQTEDKGVSNPLIETLVYVRGEILAARQSRYDDLKDAGFPEAEVARRIEAQHNGVIADVRAGRFDGNRKPRPFGEGIITNRSFDEVVLDFLRSEMGADPLVVSILGGRAIEAGATAQVEVLVTRASSGDGVGGAEVRVRLLTTAGKPKNLTKGATDPSGRALLEVALPAVPGGAAALVVQAVSGKDTAEIRQPVGQAPRAATGA